VVEDILALLLLRNLSMERIAFSVSKVTHAVY